MPAPRYTLISRPSNPVYRITAVSVPVEDLSNRLDGRWTVKPYPSYDRHLDGRTRQTVRCAALLEERMGTCPCIWQIKAVCKVLEGNDIITIAATGSGKIFTYWMLLLYAKHGIVLLITPLKLLGKQFINVLANYHGYSYF